MPDAFDLTLRMVLGLALALGVIIGLNTPGYIPSARLMLLARMVDTNSGRAAMAGALRDLRGNWRGHGRLHVTAAEIGVRAGRFPSWQNDEGLLAMTTIDCPPARPCTVAAAALIGFDARHLTVK